MTRLALAATAAALALAAAGCAPQTSAVPQEPAAPARGKPAAPVSVDAQLSGESARVTVRFDADAADVRVDVHGAGGLAVTSAPVPVEKGAFRRGDTTAFDVAFTPGPGRSYLAVTVSGRFHGAGHRATVASFPVGDPTPEQQKAPGTVIEGGGERIKVVVPGQ